MNTMSNLYNGLPPTTNMSGRVFSGRSQTNVNSIVPYNVENKNNNDDWNGPSEYDYCRPGTNPDFGSYHSLTVIVISILWHTRLANMQQRFATMVSCQVVLT